MMQKNTSNPLRRIECPYCSLYLLGRIEKIKLDRGGDPLYGERIYCIGCNRYVFTADKGRRLYDSKKS